MNKDLLQVFWHLIVISFLFFYSPCFAFSSSKYPWYFEPNQVEKCWKITRGEGVVVDVLDSKIHFVSILKGKNYSILNPDYTSVSSSKPSDLNWLHGTGIASLIVGDISKLKCDSDSELSCKLYMGSKNIVVAGIAPKAKIIGRARIPKGDTYQAMVDSIHEEIPSNILGGKIRKVARNAKLILINISGGKEDKSGDINRWFAMIKRNAKSNPYFLIVAAVGNDGKKLNSRADGVIPAIILPSKGLRDPIIRVGAVEKYDSTTKPRVHKKSNYGKKFVDIMAPGHAIPLLTPSSEATLGNGTSESAAIVSGAAALLSSCNPFADADGIKQALLNNSSTYPYLNDKVKNGKVLNIYSVVNNYCKKSRKKRVCLDAIGKVIPCAAGNTTIP